MDRPTRRVGQQGPSRQTDGPDFSRLQNGPEFSEPEGLLTDNGHGNGHYALIYETDDELFRTAVPFVCEGLEQGERCMYVVDDRADRERFVEKLLERDVDVENALESGALTFHTIEEAYLGESTFDPDEMVSFYADILEETLQEYDGFRVVGGTNWIDDVSIEKFMEYEGRVNTIFEGEDAMALCHYDRRELPPDVIGDAILTHPHLTYNDRVCHNSYFIPPEDFLDEGESESEIDRMLSTVYDRAEAKDELREHRQFLEQAYVITSDPDLGFEAKLVQLLEMGCDFFDLEVGSLTHLPGWEEEYRIEKVVGTDGGPPEGIPAVQPGKGCYCRQAITEDDPVDVEDVRELGWDDDPIYDHYGIATYFGTKVSLGEEPYGTLWFGATSPREREFTERERTCLDLMGQWIQYELEHDSKTNQLRALNNLNSTARDINRELAEQSSRDEIERAVCKRLAASVSYEMAWIGTSDDGTREIVPTTTEGSQTSLEDAAISAGESDLGQDLAGRAVRTGEIQISKNIDASTEQVSWCGGPSELDISTTAAVPIDYDEEIHGVLTVYTTRQDAFEAEEREVITQLGEIVGLAIVASEHDAQLEYERERLEFVNRLVRHNLLNSLNVVKARADIVRDTVDPEVKPHLETARDRTVAMIDLVESLRSLMTALVEPEEHELEPVDGGDVLREKIGETEQTFDQAVFRVACDLDPIGPVMADELLGQMFQNLLTNAVEHNDKSVPVVTIDVEPLEEAVRVHIADNGPGIEDGVKDQMFLKGEKRFESPGTGFGLYLVREVIDCYGAEITISDNEPEGAVFSVTLPRPDGDT